MVVVFRDKIRIPSHSGALCLAAADPNQSSLLLESFQSFEKREEVKSLFSFSAVQVGLRKQTLEGLEILGKLDTLSQNVQEL